MAHCNCMPHWVLIPITALVITYLLQLAPAGRARILSRVRELSRADITNPTVPLPTSVFLEDTPGAAIPNPTNLARRAKRGSPTGSKWSTLWCGKPEPAWIPHLAASTLDAGLHSDTRSHPPTPTHQQLGMQVHIKSGKDVDFSQDCNWIRFLLYTVSISKTSAENVTTKDIGMWNKITV